MIFASYVYTHTQMECERDVRKRTYIRTHHRSAQTIVTNVARSAEIVKDFVYKPKTRFIQIRILHNLYIC